MRIHHVAYAVPDIQASASGFEILGLERCSDVVIDDDRHCAILFMRDPRTSYLVELVAPTDERSPVQRDVETTNGLPHPYHICFEVEDIDDAMQRLRSAGFMPTTNVAPAPAISNRPVCHLVSREVGLVELLDGGSSNNGA